jgi:spore maturation protein CgeB
MANILFFGGYAPGTTSNQRAETIKRLGHDINIQDPYNVFINVLESRWLGPVHFRTGYAFVQNKISVWLANLVRTLDVKPDLIWVDSGELFGPKCLHELKKIGAPIVLFNIDDPTGKRDGRRFDSLKKALPFYDLVAVVRKETEQECKDLGAKRVICVYRNYDEVAHKPFDSIDDIPQQYRSEVVFIGTWMRHERRDEFMLKLISYGVPVSIWGSRWEKSPFFAQLKPYWKGKSLGGRDYVAAIQGAKICIGLLSKGNRDLHTTRTLEVPYAGGVLCAERTSDHLAMYKEGVEAVFWSDVEECAKVCKKLLADDSLRERIRIAGMKRVRTLRTGHEDLFRMIMDAVHAPENKSHSTVQV